MTDAPKLPEPTGAAVHKALARVRRRHRAVHAHNVRRTAVAYEQDSGAPPAESEPEATSS